MPRIIGIAGWLFALGAGAGAALLYSEMESIKTELRIAREATEIVQVEAGTLKRDNEELKRQIAFVRKKNQGSAGPQSAPQSTDNKIDTAALLQQMMNGDGAKESVAPSDATASSSSQTRPGPVPSFFGPDMSDFSGAMSELFSSQDGQRFMSRIAASSVESTYGDFLDSLGLTDEKRAEVAGIFVNQQTKMSQSVMGSLTGESGGAPIDIETSEADLTTELARVLTPGQMQQYDQYQEELPLLMERRAYESQLSRTNLPPEVQTSAAAVIAEEVRAQNDAASADQFNYAERRIQGWENALARLSATVTPEEYKELESTMERQRQLYERIGKFSDSSEGESMPLDEYPLILP